MTLNFKFPQFHFFTCLFQVWRSHSMTFPGFFHDLRNFSAVNSVLISTNSQSVFVPKELIAHHIPIFTELEIHSYVLKHTVPHCSTFKACCPTAYLTYVRKGCIIVQISDLICTVSFTKTLQQPAFMVTPD